MVPKLFTPSRITDPQYTTRLSSNKDLIGSKIHLNWIGIKEALKKSLTEIDQVLQITPSYYWGKPLKGNVKNILVMQ